MFILRSLAILFFSALACFGQATAASSASVPLVIGESWTIDSAVLGEKRRINVYVPPGTSAGTALPVMYMLDGGMAEDFLHVAGLMQVGTSNMTTRPFLLVGIENTERRRDLTGPTENIQDRAIAPRVGGSKAFRSFVRDELMPEVAKRYRVTSERALIGESLAGLFVVETLVLEPGLFDTYIAIDPSLWWNDAQLLTRAGAHPLVFSGGKSLYVAASADMLTSMDRAGLAAAFEKVAGLSFNYEKWPSETHPTIYHPAALKAFRKLFHPLPAAT